MSMILVIAILKRIHVKALNNDSIYQTQAGNGHFVKCVCLWGKGGSIDTPPPPSITVTKYSVQPLIRTSNGSFSIHSKSLVQWQMQQQTAHC